MERFIEALRPGQPITAFDGVMAEAAFWADMALTAERKAYALACFNRLSVADRAAFLNDVQRGQTHERICQPWGAGRATPCGNRLQPRLCYRRARWRSGGGVRPLDRVKPSLECRYLVKGWLDRGASSVVYGESNVGKTFFAMDLALHVAAGADWQGNVSLMGNRNSAPFPASRQRAAAVSSTAWKP